MKSSLIRGTVTKETYNDISGIVELLGKCGACRQRDTTAYDGWDEFTASPTKAVIACEFSPNFDIDDSIIVLGVDDVTIPGIPYLQSGTWETGGKWNAEAGFPDAETRTRQSDYPGSHAATSTRSRDTRTAAWRSWGAARRTGSWCV